MSKPPRHFPVRSVLLVIALLSSQRAGAATLYWDGADTSANADGGTGTWDGSTTNWDNAASAGASLAWTSSPADSAVLGGVAGTITLGSNVTVAGLTSSVDGYTVAGGGFTLTSSGNITANGSLTLSAPLTLSVGQTWSVASAKTLTVSGAVTGGGFALTKTGAGTLALNGTVSNIGAFVADNTAGNALTIGSSANVSFASFNGSSATARVNVTSAGTLNVAGAFFVNNNVAGAGSFTQTGGTVNLTTATNDGFTGGIGVAAHVGATTQNNYNLQGGTLNVLNTVFYGAVGGAANGRLNITGGTANLLGMSLTGGSSSAIGALAVTGGRLNLGASGLANGATTSGSSTVTLGAATIGAFADWSSSRNITLSDAASGTTFNTLDSVDGATARTITLTGILSGSGLLNKSGAGILSLGAANTFTGTTTLSAGTLLLSHQNALQSSTLSFSAGTLVFDSSVAGNAFNIGGLTGSAALSLLNNAGTPAQVSLTVGAGNASTTFNGALSGGTLVKAGSGTLTLGAASHSLSGITVNAGRLTLSRLGEGQVNLGSTPITLAANGQMVVAIYTGLTGGSITLGAGSQLSFQNGNAGGSAATKSTVSTNLILSSGSGTANAASLGGFIYGNSTVYSGVISGTGDLRWRTGILSGGTNSATIQASSNTAGWAVNSYVGATTFEGVTLTFSLASSLANDVINPFGDSANAVAISAGTLTFLTSGGTGNTSIIENALTLSAASGITTILAREDGNLRLTGAVDVSTVGTGVVRLQSRWGFTNTKALVLAGVLSGSGSLVISRSADEQGSVVLENAANTYSGLLTLNNSAGASGILVLAADTAASSARLSLASSGAHLNVNTANASIAELSGVAESQVSARVSGQSLTVNQSSDTTFSGTLGGTSVTGAVAGLALVKSGSGSLTLGAANSHTGGNSVLGGTLRVGVAGALGSGLTTVNGGTLDLNSLAYAGSIRYLGGTLANATQHTGSLEVAGGSLALSSADALGSGPITLSGGVLDLNGFSLDRVIVISGGRLIGISGLDAASIDLSSATPAISGSIAGLLDLANKQVDVTGGLTATGTLKGAGASFSGGLVTLASTAVHAPGSSPGSQTFADGLAYASGATLQWEIELETSSWTSGAPVRGVNFDAIDVTGGDLTIASGATLSLNLIDDVGIGFDDAFWNEYRTFQAISFTSVTGNITGSFTLSAQAANFAASGRGIWDISHDASGVSLTWTPVPEPSTYGLILGGLAFAGAALRRRKSQA